MNSPRTEPRSVARTAVKWVLVAAALGAGIMVAIGAVPRVANLDLQEAVLDNDYSIVITITVRNSGAPGFCALRVQLTLADQGTWTREVRMFLWPNEVAT